MFDSLFSYYKVFLSNLEEITPKIIGAIIILFVGLIISKIVLFILKRFFRKIKLNEIILKYFIDDPKKYKKIFNSTTKYDLIISKSISYYVFILFFRLCISYLGITEIETFLKDLINYLPNLFIGVVIGFFGLRFADTIYTVVSHTLSFSKENVAKVVAYGAKIIILFFTFMLVVSYTKIINEFVINAVIVGFISMMSIAGGLAFGLGGKDIARDVLESIRKQK